MKEIVEVVELAVAEERIERIFSVGVIRGGLVGCISSISESQLKSSGKGGRGIGTDKLDIGIVVKEDCDVQ